MTSITKNLIVGVTLLIALIGGIPGGIGIYQYFTSRPKVAIVLNRIDFGSLQWPNDSQKYSYILLELDVSNGEISPIPLPQKPFSLSVKVDRKWIELKKTYIPLSGTRFCASESDTTCGNIDHMDLQKFRELNVSRLYGHFESWGRKSVQYMDSKHYILFITTQASFHDLEKTFKEVNHKDLPLRLYWQDMRGNINKPFFSALEPLRITKNCYQVFATKVKYYN